MLEIKSLSVTIGKSDILKHLTLSIPRKSQVAIIGPNGAGKSTFLHAILKLIPSYSDKLALNGKSMSLYSRRALAKKVSFIPQDESLDPYITPYLYCEMARFPHQMWHFKLSQYEEELIERTLKLTCIDHLKHHAIMDLSGGERQRVYIAGALVQESDAIFLDEPTSSLDPKYRFEINELLKRVTEEKEKTLLYITHDINVIKSYFSHVLALKEGEIAFFGEVEHVLTEKSLSNLYDYPFKCILDESGKEFYF